MLPSGKMLGFIHIDKDLKSETSQCIVSGFAVPCVLSDLIVPLSHLNERWG